VAIRLANRTTIGGVAATLVAAAAIVVAFGASRSGAAAADKRSAALGESRQTSLTVNLPPAVTDKIYGNPAARGRPIVVVDAGHGGRDPGARSVSGELAEKDLTLALARELRDKLVERGRVRVAMTREDDRYLTLDERAAVAQRLGAAIFVSLHIDSAANPLARGASVYSLSDVASDAEAARMAAAENAGDSAGLGSGSVDSLLSDLSMRTQMSASADLASRLVNKSAGRFELRPEPHRFAAFHVLRRAQTPAVLFEAGYLSNVDDQLLLRDPAHRSAIVLALAQAIEADVAARSRH
jgi:N-acetylmuramoyl-L-alanine amidase